MKAGDRMRWLGLDFHTLATLIFRGWAIVAGGTTALIAPAFLDRTEQGYFFTFLSLVALQIFFELGFNYVITQVVSVEAAHLHLTDSHGISGPRRSAMRAHAVIAAASRFYKFSAVAYLIVVSGVGLHVLGKGVDPSPQHWEIVWLLLTFMAALNLYLSPYFAFLEGFGKVGDVARIRSMQSVIGYALMWIGLVCGLGLMAMPLVGLSAVVVSSLWIFHRRAAFAAPAVTDDALAQSPADGETQALNWRKEIFPFQWRITVSWISGYFLFQLFNPLVFSAHGAIEAGRLGLALSIFSALLTLSMSWVYAQTPQFGRLVGAGDRTALMKLFRRAALSSAIVNAGGSILILGGYLVVERFAPGVTARTASIGTLASLAVINLANQVIFSIATLLRAHRREPMLLASVVGAVLSALVMWFSVKLGVATMMACYAALTALVLLPWTLIIYRREMKHLSMLSAA